MKKMLSPPDLKKVRITEPFFKAYDTLIKEVVIPYQWQVLNDLDPEAVPSYSIRNLKIAAGLIEGEFDGRVFQDSDTYKWLEAVGYALQSGENPEAEAQADQVIDILEKAQRPDGYLNSYYIITGLDKRWTNVKDNHELYCAGHFIEAAVAYYDATGKRKVLDIACRLADHIDSVFGPEDGKLHGYPGHQEIELALVKLYRVTKEERYLRLAAYFINERGKEPNFFTEESEKYGVPDHWHEVGDKWDYHQAHKPVREQTKAVGHAVRATYMYTGMADVAALTGDEQLLNACRVLWDDIVNRQMYITGGIGSSHVGERFTLDYDLPLDTMYNETCASIALIFFTQRMLNIERDARYAEVMEQALYNTVLAGMSMDGTRFFYVNPMESWPERYKKSGDYVHVLPTRPKWFGCACCPPNVARLVASLGQYAYSYDESNIYINLFVGSDAVFSLNCGEVALSSESQMPWSGSFRLKVNPKAPCRFALHIRRPFWAQGFTLRVNGENAAFDVEKNYAVIEREWKPGDVVELEMDFEARFVRANPLFRSMLGKVCVMRGPIVYCAEEADNGPGLYLHRVSADQKIAEDSWDTPLGSVVRLKIKTDKVDTVWGDFAYCADTPVTSSPSELTLIPYYAWANRSVGEMAVYFQEI